MTTDAEIFKMMDARFGVSADTPKQIIEKSHQIVSYGLALAREGERVKIFAELDKIYYETSEEYGVRFFYENVYFENIDNLWEAIKEKVSL